MRCLRTGVQGLHGSREPKSLLHSRTTSRPSQRVLNVAPHASKFSRINNAERSLVDTTYVWDEGSFKNVYTGVYTNGRREGEKCVCKVMKDGGDPYLEAAFDVELTIIAKAQHIITAFNEAGRIDRDIYLNEPEIWTFSESAGPELAGKKNMVEPMIDNFEKFNSNTGWVSDGNATWCDVMQALSHFSYHYTNGDFVLCDLQGGAYRDGVVLTDPVILSWTREFGPGDLGPKGIRAFFAQHVCNQYCDHDWMKPPLLGLESAAEGLQPDMGTRMMNSRGQMMVPTRNSRGPLSRPRTEGR